MSKQDLNAFCSLPERADAARREGSAVAVKLVKLAHIELTR